MVDRPEASGVESVPGAAPLTVCGLNTSPAGAVNFTVYVLAGTHPRA